MQEELTALAWYQALWSCLCLVYPTAFWNAALLWEATWWKCSCHLLVWEGQHGFKDPTLIVLSWCLTLDGRSSEFHLGSVNPAYCFALRHHHWYLKYYHWILKTIAALSNISMEGPVHQQAVHRHNSLWRCNFINHLSPSKSMMLPKWWVLHLSLVISS